ncbi:importin-4 isoform X2 [Dendrobates tinctorius]|uniref:importin-4 isoform X2 n=1 Tax=Dendrobates tinctorius TaxID=92724 RepID=UPI003CC9338D
MAHILEAILTNLLRPDNAVIQQATAQLKEAVKDPLIIPALCDVLRGSQDPQIRQFAAVLLRRRLLKRWKTMPLDQQESVKTLLLEAISKESEHKVRYAIAQLSAIILRNEKLERWPQFIQFVLQASRSNIPEQRQVGLLVLHCALDLNAGIFRPHFPDLIKLFNQTIAVLQNGPLLFYTVQCVISIVPELVGNETNILRSLMPKLVIAIKELIRINQVQACEAMEVFDELMESEVSVIVHHLSEVIHFCIEIAVNTSLSDNLRVKSLYCIRSLIKLKSKVIDILALHLPPEKLFQHLSPLMEPCLLSSNPYERKAGLMCLAVLSEGCADYIRNKHLQSMLQLVCQAITDENHVVRNAGLYALGQFSEYLQPDISSYSDSVLPLLLEYLSRVDPCHTAHLTKAYYALENFVENLGSKIEQYLPTLMERILKSLSNSDNVRLKELSVSALGAIASGAEKLLCPYFPSIMEVLKVHLTQTTEEGRPIQIQCLQTLGVLVDTLGKETFLPLAEDCCLLGLNLCDRIDDPNMRSCAYGLFAALSGVMEANISHHLEKITTMMLLSLKSREGIVIQYNENRTFMLFDDEADEEDVVLHDEGDDDRDPDIEGFTVENVFVDEKEEACSSLGVIAIHASSTFFPYLDSCFQEVFKLIESPHNSVRKAAYEAVGKFVRSMHLVSQKNPSEPNAKVLLQLLEIVIPTYIQGAMQDKEREVVMTILESLNNVLKDVKEICISGPEQLGKICNVIKAVLQSKTACQDEAEDGEDQAEMDAMLIEYAGEGIPLVAAVVGGITFAPYFADFLPLLLNKTKSSCSTAEKSFAVGILAESVVSLGETTVHFVAQLLPAFIAGTQDGDNEVCNNAVFGLGVLAEHGGAAMLKNFPKLLSVLSSIMSSQKNARTLDNVCGAVSRMILAHPEGVPVEQVFPVLLRSMPLKEDFEENGVVFKCIAFLYEKNPSQVVAHINDIARIFGHVLGTKEIKPDTEQTILLLLRNVAQRFTQELQNALMSLPDEESSKLRTTLC